MRRRPSSRPQSQGVETTSARLSLRSDSCHIGKDLRVHLPPEHPEVSAKDIVRGIVRRGFEPVPPKTVISLRVDADVLDWFKQQGPGYQTRINAILRAFKEEVA